MAMGMEEMNCIGDMSLVLKLRDGLLLPKELGNLSTILVIHQVPSHRIVV